MGIEIANLTGTLKTLAEIADGNGNNIIEEGKETTVFENYAKTAVQNGQVAEADYKAIFGSEIKTEEKKQVVTNPQQKTYSKEDVERKESYAVNILNEEYATTPEKFLEKLTERLGAQANDPVYQDLQGQVKFIMNAINEIGYNSKDDVEHLEDKVKEKLGIGKSDKFARKALKALVKNAEYVQMAKEFGEVKAEYDKLVENGVDEEVAFKSIKAKYDDKGSYYHEFVRSRGFFKNKQSTFEKSHIMPDARVTAREAIYASDATDSKDVKRDAKEKLISDGDWNKYTEKALGGENNFGQWISGHDSDMKIARKNQARKNLVIDIRENGLTGEEVHDAVDKKKTFLFFKKKTQLFEALVSSGLIIDMGNGKYDVSPLSELIGLHVGANYKMDRTTGDYKALAEKTKTTSALAAATELKNLTEEEAEMLVKMCGYDVEGKDWGKAILGATIGALVNGLSAAGAAASNPRAVAYNNDHFELNLNIDSDLADFMENNSKTIANLIDQGGIVNTANGFLQIIIDKNDVRRFSKFILETGLKSSIIGAAAGLIAGLKDDPEKPITSTQFECTTLEEYAKVLNSEVTQKALKPEYKDALLLIATTYLKEDGSWDCEGYKMFLNKAAGNGGVLNREELIGGLEKLKKDEPDDDVDNDDGGEEVVEEEHNYSTHDKEGIDAEYKDVPVIDGRTTSWTKIAGQYDCLVERYGLSDAIRMIKIAQGINNGDYSKETMERLLALSKKGLSHMKNIEGLDYEAYKSALTATYLPALKKDSEGNNIPGTGVKVPTNLADCVRDESQSLIADKADPAKKVVNPTGNASDRVKVRDGQAPKYYARFDGGAVQEYGSMKDRDDAVAAFRAKYPNAKVEKWSDEQ